MARIKDLDSIEPEQVNPANDLLHIVDVEANTSVDKKITVAKLLTKTPDADTTTRGLVNTSTQTLGGVKIFNDGLISSDDITVNANLNVNGNIFQNGSAYETHAEKVYTKKYMIITRDGANTGLANGEMSGIKAKKYDGTNDGILAFDNTGTARVGDEGSEEPLLTRSEVADLNNNDILVWDSANSRAVHAPRPQGNNQFLQCAVSNGEVTYRWVNATDAPKVVVTSSQTIEPTVDERVFITSQNTVLTLGYNSSSMAVIEIFAFEESSVTYYTDANTTATLNMKANTSAQFVFYNGWKLSEIYGAVWN